jgi:drug/metabolite transporter (DMT)-like permease
VIGAGIAAAFGAAVVNALAVVLQAAEARQTPDEEAMHVSLLGHLARRPRWLAGTILVVLGGGLQITANAFAPISVVQPMLATSQLVLLVVARWKLGERAGRAEIIGALAIVAGLAAVVYSAPRHTLAITGAGRLAPPMAVIGGAALTAFVLGRWHPRARLMLVLGAGLAYAWVDFAIKLLSDAVSSGRWVLVALFAAALIACGAVAFLEEMTALQHRPAITVAPVIGALKVPLPVLMALWAGIEPWRGNVGAIVVLLTGLALTAAGAASLGRSQAVARISAGADAPSNGEGGRRGVTWRSGACRMAP